MKKSLFIFLLLTAYNLSAFWAPTPLKELSKDSSEILIGEVLAVHYDKKTDKTTVDFKVIKALKQESEYGLITFTAPFSMIQDYKTNADKGTVPKSFAKGEICVVYLRKIKKEFLMTMDSDGKFILDKKMKQYKRQYVSKDEWKPISEIENAAK